MFFLIYKLGNYFKKRTFPNNTSWEEILKSFEGEVIDLFKNDCLTERDFNNYFQKLIADNRNFS